MTRKQLHDRYSLVCAENKRLKKALQRSNTSNKHLKKKLFGDNYHE